MLFNENVLENGEWNYTYLYYYNNNYTIKCNWITTYLYKYTNNYTIICIWIGVIILVQVYRLKNYGYKWTLTNFQNGQDHVFQDDNQTDQ